MDKFRTAGLVKSDIEGLPTDLLAKIVDSVPLVIPSKNVTGSTPEGRVAAPYDLNFEERAALILAVKGLKPVSSYCHVRSCFKIEFASKQSQLKMVMMK